MQRDALKKAQADGEATGMAKGKAEGIEEGRIAERNTMMLNAHKSGLPPALIANLLGMDEAQVSALLRTLLPGADV